MELMLELALNQTFPERLSDFGVFSDLGIGAATAKPDTITKAPTNRIMFRPFSLLKSVPHPQVAIES